MRNTSLTVLALALATVTPAAAQSGAERRAAQVELQKVEELRAALEARAAQRAEAQHELQAVLEAAQAHRIEGAEAQHELQAVLEAARAHRIEGAEAQHELQAVLEAARAHRIEGAEAQHELQAVLEAAQARQSRAELVDREAMEAAREVDRLREMLELERIGEAGPPEAWLPQDPADSVWRQARASLNGGDYAAAVRLFRRIRTESRFANSGYRPDAFYWEAFALARSGGTDSLREARKVLQELEAAYPPGRRSPDAEALGARLDAQLAGHEYTAAEEVYGRLAVLARSAKTEQHAQQAALAEAEALQKYAQAREAGSAANYQSMVLAEQHAKAAAQYSGELATSLRRGQTLELAAQASRQCRNDEEEIRLIALNALMEMDDTAALPALREVMARRDECAFQFRRQAMMILSRRDSPGSEAIALQAAGDDPDPEVRLLALTWLIEQENGRAFDIAQSILDTDTDPHTRQAAIMALARSRNERARQILRDFVRSDAPVEQRGEALMALPISRGSEDARYLQQLYGETNDRQLKEYALMALGRSALEGESDWLLDIARDQAEEADFRVQALMMLRAESSAPIASIAAIYDQAGERRLKEAALMMLTERSRTDAAALDKVIAIAQTDDNADFRKQAVMTLARSKDPRAQAVLLEILRKK